MIKSWFGGMSIGARIGFVCGAILTLLAVAIAVNVVLMSQATSRLSEAQDLVRSSHEAENWVLEMAAQRSMQAEYVTTLDPTIPEEFEASAVRAFAIADELAARFSDNQIVQENVANAKALDEQHDPLVFDQLFPAAEAGDSETVSKLLPVAAGLVVQFVDASTAVRDEVVRLAEAQEASAQSALSRSRTILIALGAAAFAVGFVLAFLLARSVSQPLRRLKEQMEQIARGQIALSDDAASATPHGRNEVAAMRHAFHGLAGYVRGMADAAARIARGDLSVDVQAHSPDDALGVAFGQMTDGLRGIVHDLGEASTAISDASSQMAATAEQAGRAVGEIALAVGDVAQGAEQQARMVDDARIASDEAAQAASSAREVADEGVGAAEEASVAMAQVRESAQAVTQAIRELGDRSEAIGGIVSTITSIAEQTNLLALNAAIEAARAGEQGRGFAVVAEEVRKLAEESQQAASSIASLISEMQAETQRTVSVVEDGASRSEEGAVVVERAREAFQSIGAVVGEMSQRIERIAQGTTEVASVAEQTSAATEQVSASAEETSASTQEVAASAQALADTARALEAIVGRFTVAA